MSENPQAFIEQVLPVLDDIEAQGLDGKPA
jgi:hypothetical protein